ncbi:Uncharacterised protein [Vibrio cholerae]|uniref:Uncharacterized protein n=1 Tax=Vibrio cholerae TaxID=666 RepID=A0A655YUF1_VIBCL|nr:Uncharacterised protein [Vibrio cholerae]CSA09330.1 Uncharacterised protein [Vibrio cholerae]CSA53193.1 Uncharacterised protein [Vibrio cholerae]CSB03251.1 Uncharacterised protein [Vibrio cholerae]CSB66046.1 Uncharacterised protein [Vibrio cholerae]
MTTQCFQVLASQITFRCISGVCFCFHFFVFTTWRFQVERTNGECERKEVQSKERQTNHKQSCRFRC